MRPSKTIDIRYLRLYGRSLSGVLRRHKTKTPHLMRINLIIVGRRTMKIHNIILCAFFLLTITGNIHAASFDCGKSYI